MKTSLCNQLFLCTAALALVIMGNTTAQAQFGGLPLWTNRSEGSGFHPALAVDGSGNVFVAGSSLGTNVNYGYTTIKYSSAGTALWTNRYNGGYGDDTTYAIAVDSNGNVFVTGRSVFDSSGYHHYATLKYSAAGMPLWTNTLWTPEWR